jgi:hypothetical protein
MASGASDAGDPSRRSKAQKRLDHIFGRIPVAREQLLAAVEDFAPTLTVDAIREAAQRRIRVSGTRSR